MTADLVDSGDVAVSKESWKDFLALHMQLLWLAYWLLSVVLSLQ